MTIPTETHILCVPTFILIVFTFRTNVHFLEHVDTCKKTIQIALLKGHHPCILSTSPLIRFLD